MAELIADLRKLDKVEALNPLAAMQLRSMCSKMDKDFNETQAAKKGKLYKCPNCEQNYASKHNLRIQTIATCNWAWTEVIERAKI